MSVLRHWHRTTFERMLQRTTNGGVHHAWDAFVLLLRMPAVAATQDVSRQMSGARFESPRTIIPARTLQPPSDPLLFGG